MVQTGRMMTFYKLGRRKIYAILSPKSPLRFATRGLPEGAHIGAPLRGYSVLKIKHHHPPPTKTTAGKGRGFILPAYTGACRPNKMVWLKFLKNSESSSNSISDSHKTKIAPNTSILHVEP